MSSTAAQQDPVAVAANRLSGLSSAMGAKNAAVAPPTTGVVPAAADDVSALMAAQFAVQAQIYQAVSAQVCQAVSAQAAALELLVSTLRTSGNSDTGAERIDAAAADL